MSYDYIHKLITFSSLNFPYYPNLYPKSEFCASNMLLYSVERIFQLMRLL